MNQQPVLTPAGNEPKDLIDTDIEEDDTESKNARINEVISSSPAGFRQVVVSV